jgi:hypothetical protein
MYRMYRAWKSKLLGLRGKARKEEDKIWLEKAGVEGVHWMIVEANS